MAQLFAEELGVVLQIRTADQQRFKDILTRHGLAENALPLGAPTQDLRVRIQAGEALFDEPWVGPCGGNKSFANF